MVINKIFNYKSHIKTIFYPIVNFRMKYIKSGINLGEKNNIVISLTSYGERIKDIKYTLISLFNQTLKPDRIVLWLGEDCKERKLPQFINKFTEAGLEIKYTKDIGPYTKIIPSLINFSDSIIVTADDDIYYPNNWLEKLYNSYLGDKNSIHCHRAHRIKIDTKTGELLPYESWNKQVIGDGVARFDNFLTGVGGVLYPPHFFNKEVLSEPKFLELSPKADDVWLWAMAVLSGVKICIVKDNIKTLRVTNIFRQLNWLREKTLYNSNKNGGNDEQITSVLNCYPEIKKILSENKKISLIYNASSLFAFNDKSGNRAGVFNVAYNLFLQFLNCDNFDISVYSDYKYFYFIKEFLIPDNRFSSIELIDKRRLFEKFLGLVYYNINFLSKKLSYLCLYLLRILDKILPLNSSLINKISNYDAYFSPFEGISKEFLQTGICNYQFIHDVIPLLDGKKLPKYHWANSVFKNITNDVFYFTNSNYTKKDFLKVFSNINPERVKVSYLGCSKEPIKNTNIYSKYGISGGKKYFLSLCSLGKRKNLKFAVENFIEFVNQNQIDDLVFVLAGGIWNKYKRELKEISRDKRIIVTGYVSEEDLPLLYAKAHSFIYPSLYEGFGLPILEAMNYGVPVIASNRTSIPEVCGDAALIINPEDSEGIKQAYKDIYFNNELRETLIKKGSQRANDFTWENCADIIKQEIINQCVLRRKSY